MAYLDTPPLKHRLASLGTAGAIELAIAVALVGALSFNFVPEEDVPQIKATNIPDDVPPPPDIPQPQSQRDETVIEVPTPPVEWDLPDLPDIPVTDTTGDVFDGPIVSPSPTPPRETPRPTYEPAAAKPANNASRWVTTEDYPARDLREGNQGTTRFRAIVGSNGRVVDCEVTHSSGSVSLDKAACANVKRRARFEPATDASGAKVVGTYTSSVVWRIPR